MKQYKVPSKDRAKSPLQKTTRQEVDEIAKHIASHIERNPAKAAKLFESWLNGKSKNTAKKKAA